MKIVDTLKSYKYVSLLKNPFFLVGLLFVIWIIFFDSSSLLEQRTINAEIKKIEDNKRYFEKEIEKDKKAIKGLKSGDATEKYARENYYMKRENEDVFIIEFDSLPAK
ncbi:FtsB family cell division protein [Myroides marinus]|uniref:FtsB family cell division protein n=1 Tax=Myroides marinus TaxID=703342 RepID=UPI000741D4F8|nr:septum formation initiator family protein [Myroides marinus]KUF39326.1 septum formation initiator [Myroides marinus]MDM1372632.1 septum formation initiator family protein [Myroides marinus]MDM1377634.1 septum formation initiator family protein [Myroides marinus]MDM1384686.1 septum formation initiator family protein [Myroides marinus]MDM1392118.1 septum formation initiator family protein [Myroides marinus]